MALVIVAVERPLDLIGVSNGKLDADLLVTVPGGGKLHHLAARAWAALCTEAAVAGYNLTYTPGGCYRTYSAQESLFRSRYVNPPVAGRPYKNWNGKIWSQKPGVAMAAAPGTSNHGLGLAIDTALDNDPGDGISPNDATSIAPALGWLEHHAPLFGFSWETLPSEPWHIRYVTGDHIPQAVLAHETPTAPAPVPPMEDAMPIVTNSEAFFGAAAGVAKFVLQDNGRLRLLDGVEWETRGSLTGTPWANADIGRHGVDQ